MSPVCLGSDATQGRPGENPIVALTFNELLERLMADGGFADRPTDYGDADMFSDREKMGPPAPKPSKRARRKADRQRREASKDTPDS